MRRARNSGLRLPYHLYRWMKKCQPRPSRTMRHGWRLVADGAMRTASSASAEPAQSRPTSSGTPKARSKNSASLGNRRLPSSRWRMRSVPSSPMRPMETTAGIVSPRRRPPKRRTKVLRVKLPPSQQVPRPRPVA